jgi:hypothetical protein
MFNPDSNLANSLEDRLDNEVESRKLYNQQKIMAKYAKNKDLQSQLDKFDTNKDFSIGADGSVESLGLAHLAYNMSHRAGKKVLDKVAKGSNISDAVSDTMDDEVGDIRKKYGSLADHFDNVKNKIGKLKSLDEMKNEVVKAKANGLGGERNIETSMDATRDTDLTNSNRRVSEFDPDSFIDGKRPKEGAKITRTNVVDYTTKPSGENYDNPLANEDEEEPIDKYESVSKRGTGTFEKQFSKYRYKRTGVVDHSMKLKYSGSDDIGDEDPEDPFSARSKQPSLRHTLESSHSTLDNQDERILPSYSGETEKIYNQRPGGIYKYSNKSPAEVPKTTDYAEKPKAEVSETGAEAEEGGEGEGNMAFEPEVQPRTAPALKASRSGPSRSMNLSATDAPEADVADVAKEGEKGGFMKGISKITDSTAGKILGKAAFVAPAAYDIYSDIKAKKIVGANWQEKAANIITPISTAVSFIPGAGEVIGGLGDLASAGLSIWGDIEEKKDKAKNIAKQIATPAKKMVMPQATNLSDIGGYSNQAIKSAPTQMMGGSF